MATLAGHAEIYDGFLKTAERLGLVGTEAVKFANDQADGEERRVDSDSMKSKWRE